MSINLIVSLFCCMLFSILLTFNNTKRLISRVVLVLSLIVIMEVAGVAYHSHVIDLEDRHHQTELARALQN